MTDDTPTTPADQESTEVRRVRVRTRRRTAAAAIPEADFDMAPTADPATRNAAEEAVDADDDDAVRDDEDMHMAVDPASPAQAEASADEPVVVRRRRSRRRTARLPEPEIAADIDAPLMAPVVEQITEVEDDLEVVDAEVGAAEEGVDEAAPRRSRRRRGRGRRGRGRGRVQPDGDEETADADDSAALDVDVDDEVVVVDIDEDDEDGTTVDVDEQAPAPTRLQARARRTRERSKRTRSEANRRPYGGVSEETRRTIAESPPRRMMVTVGEERTQIAVMEERTLVEHYVTKRSDVSYVGNIYMGRVQNVLPGMEAAFVDIGKGRNGVLYAGEVNYDDADLETDLPRIEQTLKPGQAVLVQVTKDPMGTKGARLTQHLSIAGRYCVLAPGDNMLGISRKLSEEERDRLRKILKTVKPDEYGLIVRTAAEGATAEQLEADVQRLVRIWEQVQQRMPDVKPLEPVYTEPDLVIRVIRDIFGPDYTELIVDSAELAAEVRAYLGDVSPELVDRVKVHAGDDNIFDAYEITNQIRRALEKKVWLKSGGYLIIEKTEAMWIIDVNTGKFVGERNLEETVLKNNLEAAVEIVRQLRLRDMGGIIVIDFVDMLVPANRDEVLKRFKRELARDKTKSRVMEISKLGLVQMTRKNVSQGLQESFTVHCDACDGRGRRIVDKIV